LVARKATMVPTHGQSIFEMLIEFMLDLVESAAGKNVGRRIFPLIGGLFIFILVCNYAGLLPGVGTVGINETHVVSEEHASVASSDIALYQDAAEVETEEVIVPFFRSPSADLNMTLAMSI